MTATTVPLGLHTAHLDPMTGVGVLMCPDPSDDVWLGGSLNWADWDAAVRELSRLGWEPLLGDDDDLIYEDGFPGRAVALYGREPVQESASVAELAAALGELRRVASLTSTNRALPS